MKTKRVATQNARRIFAESQYITNWGFALLLVTLVAVISCNSDDGIETIKSKELIEEVESIIVYTDIEPDFNSENGKNFYNLDLNNDLTTDFTLKTVAGYVLESEALEISSSSDSSSGCFSFGIWGSFAIPISSNGKIHKIIRYGKGESFSQHSGFLIGNCSQDANNCQYYWNDRNEQYLGLNISINGQIHYGWARLLVINETQWVIKDYAYNATPNNPIFAGQKE